MSDEAHYVRVGAFVLGGIALAVIAAMLFGGGDFFAPNPLVAESVFEESVQGLDVGSPVLLRGVHLGTVKWIGFVGEAYDVNGSMPLEEAGRALVRMEITKRVVEDSGDQQALNIRTLVERGLRLRLTPLGLTGTSYLQAEFLDPERYPPIQISFEPDTLYLPSAPSTINQLSSAAERLMTRIDKLDVERLLTNFDTLLVRLNDALGQADVAGARKSLGELLVDARDTSAALRRTIESADLRGTSAQARHTLEDLRGAIARLQLLTDRSGEDLAVALDNLRVASANLREMSETARAYPSYLLFGDAPPVTNSGDESKK